MLVCTLLTLSLSVPLSSYSPLSAPRTSRLGQMEYTGYRNVIYFSDPSSLALDNIGPLVTYTILVQNSLDSSTGTPFPRSTLYIHFPTDVVKEIDIPLLVPTSIAVTTGVDNVNCSHFEAISKSLVCLFYITAGNIEELKLNWRARTSN